ncbi:MULTISPECIES: terpene synthase family protein [unclassified Streptomyces]|uniref:terpene synthase family protein n=1 Tax=unclassified Streptomyces TaxID=2593676 RepID=UPI00340A6318
MDRLHPTRARNAEAEADTAGRTAAPGPAPDPSGLLIPPLSLPFSARPHPAAQEICEETLQWTRQSGLVQPGEQERCLTDSRIGLSFPSVVPHGDADAVLLGSCINIWVTLADDQIMEKHGRPGGALARAMGRLVQFESISRAVTSDATAPGLPRALAGLSQRLQRIAAPDQVLRAQRHLLQYFMGLSTEAAYTHSNTTPTIADYTRVRQLTTCMPLFFTLAEVARGVHIPARTLMQPEAQKLTALGSYLIGAMNDIIGLRRDLQRGDTWVHARLLVQHHNCTYQEAADLLAAEFRRQVDEFTTIADACCTTDPQYGSAYADIVRDVVAGYMHWAQLSPRYTLDAQHQ